MGDKWETKREVHEQIRDKPTGQFKSSEWTISLSSQSQEKSGMAKPEENCGYPHQMGDNLQIEGWAGWKEKEKTPDGVLVSVEEW